MKYYLIFGIANNGNSTATICAKDKYTAIKKAREMCPLKQYVPIIVKRISKKMYYLIGEINPKEVE